MGRLVVISNRLPVGDNPSGGLVVALQPPMAERGGLWIGTAGEPIARAEPYLHDHPGAAFARKSLALTQAEYDNYYLGYSNSVLWPLCHGRPDLLDIRPEYFEGYTAVNRRLAALVAKALKPDDVVWVQDYHLVPMASELRRLGVANPIGFFLHIPFPSASNFRALSNAGTLADWLCDYDLVGLQTQRDVAACLEVFRSLPDSEILLDGRIKRGERTVRVRAFPISIDTMRFAHIAAQASTGRTRILPSDHRLIIGVDRLDYSKGLLQRLRGFQQFLQARPHHATRVSLLQIAPPTREAVAAYSDLRAELERLSGEINGEFATIGYTPVQYIHRSVPRDDLAGFYRRASVGLVTSLADGMNLVAKEYVAAQDPDHPGALVLSTFAGAFEELGTHAIGVNPYDASDIAHGIRKAIDMPMGERKARHAALMDVLVARDVAHWADSYLRSLTAA